MSPFPSGGSQYDNNMQEMLALLRLSGASETEPMRGSSACTSEPNAHHLLECGSVEGPFAGGVGGQPAFCPATADGLTECMEEAQCASEPDTSGLLEDAVVTILREIGDDPARKVTTGYLTVRCPHMWQTWSTAYLQKEC